MGKGSSTWCTMYLNLYNQWFACDIRISMKFLK